MIGRFLLGLSAGLMIFTYSAYGQEQVAPNTASSSATSDINLGFRFDCLHSFNSDKGASQSCLNVSGIALTYQDQLSSTLGGFVLLNPLAPASANLDYPISEGVPKRVDTELGIVADYALEWTPRPNLTLAVENYSGATSIPEASGLSLAQPFADAGFDQVAFSITFNLPALHDIGVKFVGGNGEGELVSNQDPQQYFGFEASGELTTGLIASFGTSFDGNNIGSLAYDLEKAAYGSGCGDSITSATSGYSTQRLAAGLHLDGNFPGMRGLQIGLGWQRNTQTDLNSNSASAPSLADFGAPNCLFDISTVFVEVPGQVNTVERTVIGLSASYRVLDTYFLGVDYQTRTVDAGSAELFRSCRGFENRLCSVLGDSTSTLNQTGLTLGGGLDIDQNVSLTIEYHKQKYDSSYVKAHFVDREKKRSDTLELFNARLAYNWL